MSDPRNAAPPLVDVGEGELDRLREAMEDLNDLRSNITATQSASWSNAAYPLVAILNRAGYEDHAAERTQEQLADHMLTYGGAGHSPRHIAPDTRKGKLWQDRRDNTRNVIAESRARALATTTPSPETPDE